MKPIYESPVPDLEPFRDYLRLLAQIELSARLRSRVDPSDIVQETFLRAHPKLDEWRGRRKEELAAWLRQILANQMANLLRDHRREKRDFRREVSLDASLDNSSARLLHLVDAKQSTPSRQARRSELALKFAEVLMRLPGDQREVFVLKHWEGWKLDAIAEHMGRTRPAVTSLLRRATSTLRAELKDFE